MFTVLKKDETFDVIIFNPPYLPTTEQQKIGKSGWIDKALNGGEDGLKFTKKFINEISKYLKDNARAYFVFSSLSNKKKLLQIIKRNNLKHQIIKYYDFGSERIDLFMLEK